MPVSKAPCLPWLLPKRLGDTGCYSFLPIETSGLKTPAKAGRWWSRLKLCTRDWRGSHITFANFITTHTDLVASKTMCEMNKFIPNHNQLCIVCMSQIGAFVQSNLDEASAKWHNLILPKKEQILQSDLSTSQGLGCEKGVNDFVALVLLFIPDFLSCPANISVSLSHKLHFNLRLVKLPSGSRDI